MGGSPEEYQLMPEAQRRRIQYRRNDPPQEHVPQDRLNTDANETLSRLFKLIVPRARDIFASLTWLRLLHVNQYSMEKSFVYGIVALSKWLGQDRFPPGIYDVWPPTPTSTSCGQGSQPSGSGAGREA